MLFQVPCCHVTHVAVDGPRVPRVVVGASGAVPTVLLDLLGVSPREARASGACLRWRRALHRRSRREGRAGGTWRPGRSAVVGARLRYDNGDDCWGARGTPPRRGR